MRMSSITKYLNGLDVASQLDFARRCGTSVGYLRKAASIGQKIGEGLCIALERESQKAIRCEELRPDVDWAYLRNGGGEAELAERKVA